MDIKQKHIIISFGRELRKIRGPNIPFNAGAGTRLETISKVSTCFSGPCLVVF